MLTCLRVHRLTSTAAGALVVLVLAGCGSVGEERSPQPLPSRRIAVSVTMLENQMGMGRAVPGSGAAEQGVLYGFKLLSHCGVNWWSAWDFDGSFWDPVPGTGEPSFEEVQNPFDEGTIELTGPDQARFTSSSRFVVELLRSSDREREGFLCI